MRDEANGSAMAGVMPPCRHEGINVTRGGYVLPGQIAELAEWAHAPIQPRQRVGFCTQPRSAVEPSLELPALDGGLAESARSIT